MGMQHSFTWRPHAANPQYAPVRPRRRDAAGVWVGPRGAPQQATVDCRLEPLCAAESDEEQSAGPSPLPELVLRQRLQGDLECCC